jgi:tetratricopeptide (TPR) repeat protein/tRNA A-37 threonylcarbamoyl transferase component Bud32
MADPCPTPPGADRNLLFGILALQMDCISRDALIQGMHAWVLDKAKPLGQILVEQGALAADEYALLEPLVQKHLERHGHNAGKSLAAVSSTSSVRDALKQVADADVQTSLTRLMGSQDATSQAVPPYVSRLDAPGFAGPRYCILRPHARGGLGEVFVAEDKELHREVALKEIQLQYANDPHSRGRFLVEAEITGSLEHPGVVPVYGLGHYPDGRPFYAMRFVKGDSLKDAISRFHQMEGPGRDPGERSLGLRQLLGRFVDVCNAVAYAHSRGVLHRDLKPGNVMLGRYGETLVVDWGLAKVVGRPEAPAGDGEATLRPSSGSEVAATRKGSVLGTPAFMSPEQAAGKLDQLGPASDIYGLGATLYALLTGRAPVPGQDDGPVLDKVQRGEVVPPRQVKADIPAPLEAICRKAMALRPEDRYATALDLAADVEHWLADEPVAAYPEPWTTRARRWARRHRPLVAGVAAALAVALLLGGGVWWWLEQKEAERREEAARQEARTRQAVEAALELVEGLQARARWAEAEATLVQAKSRLGEQGTDDLRQRLDQTQANLRLVKKLDTIRLDQATVTEGKLNTAGAAPAYEAAFKDHGLDMRAGDEAALARRVAASPVKEPLLAALEDWAYVAPRDRERLLAVARRADPAEERNRFRDPALWDDPGRLRRLAVRADVARLSPVLVANLANRPAGVEELGLLQRAQRRHPADFWLNFQLGLALHLRGRHLEAAGYYRAALALRPQTAAVLNGLGNALESQGKREEAIAAYQQAIALDPKLAAAHYNLGIALKAQGDRDGAIAAYQKAIALAPKFALAHNNLGNLLRAKGDRDGAVAAFQKAIACDPRNAMPYESLGNTLMELARFGEALVAYRKARDLSFRERQKVSRLTQMIQSCSRMLELDKRLPAVLRKKDQPASPGEYLEFGDLCYYKRLFGAAARFYQEGFAARPKLAEDLVAGHRYDAACSAALAGCGRGKDADQLDDPQKCVWRKQALAWLRADLALWATDLARNLARVGAASKQTIRDWMHEQDLAGVREPAALAKLPAAERAAWKKFWADVDALLKRVQDKR